MATRHFVQRRKVRIAWRANFKAIWLISAIRNHINTKLAFGMLHRRVSLSRGHVEAFGKEFKMVNHVFHIGFHAFTVGRRHFIIRRNHITWVGAQPRNALFYNVIGLPKLFHPHQITVVTITVDANWNIEIQMSIHFVRLLFT